MHCDAEQLAHVARPLAERFFLAGLDSGARNACSVGMHSHSPKHEVVSIGAGCASGPGQVPSAASGGTGATSSDEVCYRVDVQKLDSATTQEAPIPTSGEYEAVQLIDRPNASH